MKLNGEIEISGITKIVFNKVDVWNKIQIEDKIIWYNNSERGMYFIPHETAIAEIKKDVKLPDLYRVWVHEHTINIEMV